MTAIEPRSAVDEAWGGFDVAVLGGGLCPQVQDLLARAGACRQDVAQASALLDQAEALAAGHPAVLIARYRFHFYGHRLDEARSVAREALKMARQALRREAVGHVDVSPLPSDEQVRFDAAVRFYLFSLKGYAYLCLRLGDLAEGRLALAELQRLDPQDRLGGSLLAQVLMRAERADRGEADEDADADDEALSLPSPNARGWRSA